ncbi:hypothetical protein BN1002_04386 [Bacillus sp. B-jedd]|nr:hypothetical protein BN1002_04386 [Bacillus sp. B-jedd]
MHLLAHLRIEQGIHNELSGVGGACQNSVILVEYIHDRMNLPIRRTQLLKRLDQFSFVNFFKSFIMIKDVF